MFNILHSPKHGRNVAADATRYKLRLPIVLMIGKTQILATKPNELNTTAVNDAFH